MAFKISGNYVGSCECQLICACSLDAKPTGRNGSCTGSLVFNITQGTADDVDLSGIAVAMMYHAPSNMTSGNLRMGIVVDESASDAQAQALEQIFSGKAGGPFAEFVPFVGTWLGVERASVTYSDGDKPSATIGSSSISFEAARNAEGTATTVKNAMLGFAEEYEVGTGSGSVDAHGMTYDSVYGEAAAFEFAS